MNFYKLLIQYRGTDYFGFQVQTEDQRTIQGEINRALKEIAKSDEIKSIGSGRTDAGVHALGQVVRICIPLIIPPESLVRALNSHLPHDIRVISAENCDENFHPIFTAKLKEYNYVFTLETLGAFSTELITHYPHDLDIEKMNKACKLFLGEHDFVNFQCQGTEVATTVRDITECEVLSFDTNGHWSNLVGKYYVIRVVGNGFLKQMVRLMVGALWNIGRGKIEESDLHRALKVPVERRLGATAPPQGLYLKVVHY